MCQAKGQFNHMNNTMKQKQKIFPHPVSDFLRVNHDSGFETPNFIVKVFHALPGIIL
jgi:hypothetical protein